MKFDIFFCVLLTAMCFTGIYRIEISRVKQKYIRQNHEIEKEYKEYIEGIQKENEQLKKQIAALDGKQEQS